MTYDDWKTRDDTPEPAPVVCEKCEHRADSCDCPCCNEYPECPACGSPDPCLRGFALDAEPCADRWHAETVCFP